MSAARHLLKLREAGLIVRRLLARIAARTPLRLTAFAVLALVTTWPWLSDAGALNDFRDAHFHGHYEAIAATIVARWHQVPLWDPYYCGGMYLFGAPQTRFFSPTLLLTLLLGEARAEPFTAFVMILVGLEGTFRYARVRGATAVGSLLAAPMFGLMGMFAVIGRLGWMNFYAFELLPWVAYWLHRAMRAELKAVAIGALILAWVFASSTSHGAPLTALWCVFQVGEAVVLAFARGAYRSAAVAAGSAAAVASLALGVGAVHLWPVAEVWSRSSRIIGGAPGMTLHAALDLVFRTATNDNDNGFFFVGIFVVPAVVLGLWRLHLRSVGAAVGLSLAVWGSLGYGVSPSFFAAIRTLPAYETIRYPERFWIFAALFASVLAARGVTTMEAYARLYAHRGMRRRMVFGGLAVVAALGLVIDVGPLVGQHFARFKQHDTFSPPSRALADRPFHQARGNRWALGYYEPMNRGSLSCYEPYPVPQSRLLRGDLKAEEYLLDEQAGTVTETRWSPNEIELDVDLQRPARLAVNQNFHTGWRSSVGQVSSEQGLLAVDLPAGTNHVRLSFSPRSAKAGFLVTLVSLGALVVLWRARRQDLRVLAGAACAPPAAVAVAALTFREPPPPPPDLRALDGQPIIVDQLPNLSRRLNAKFESGMTLEGVWVSDSSPTAGSEIIAEFDWRRTRQGERGLGVFVHFDLVVGKGEGMNGDHVLFSAALDPEKAPIGKTLRDQLPITFPEDAHGRTYKIYVGLWRIRRDDSRVKVVDMGEAFVDNDRVYAFTITVR